MNTQLENLMAKHLNGTLGDEEKKLLARLLNVPEHQLHLAAKIDEAFLDENLKEEADDAIGTYLFQRIQERIKQNKQAAVPLASDSSASEAVHISWYKRSRVYWMAAASIILIITVAILYNNRSNGPSMAVQSNRPADSALYVVHREVNTTGKEKEITLADGSRIVLADKSEITYRDPFGDKRDITLIGKAYFRVAKDKTRPFTVFSGAVSTTALGTEFLVTAFAQAGQITVRLYEGKVVVRAVEKGNWRMKDDVYLIPGQELIYNSQALAKVRVFKMNKTNQKDAGKNEFTRDHPSLPEDAKDSWYMFNNQSLEQVLNNLAALYNVKIVYNKKDVQHIYFTGKYNKSESLETILKRIGTLNNLTITQKDSAFIISK